MQVEHDDCINFTEMSRDESHVVTLLSVALHYGGSTGARGEQTPKETPRLSISPVSYFER